MTTLPEAWEWYRRTRRQLRVMQRLGTKHVERVLAVDAVGRDDAARDGLRTAVADTAVALAPLDDLAVLVLFSVFEAVVRQGLLTQLMAGVTDDAHPVVRKAMDEAKQGIESDSFHNNVLSPYKLAAGVGPDLVEEVSQVREYRNFVAHGRQEGKRPPNVSPRMAFDRLSRFLVAVGLAKPTADTMAAEPDGD